ncbi:MAG: T9SS type B sorting domain-containing protein [Flavobacteriaceae bacterium]|nr:T9SS type B sorting domain-containing protein [Flavobacteriaceae bacterium]
MMEKLIKSFVCLFLIIVLSNTNVFAKSSITSFANETLATAPPTVYSPVTYWQNCSKPLIAIPSGGGTLNWYTLLVGGIALPGAPTPITTTIGSTTTYYVSQTISSVESIRVPIVVKVEADSGATILNLTCDPSQIPTYSLDYTPPATIDNSVLFDWANNNAFLSHAYFCTYSIQGGASVTEFNPKMDLSHFIVTNLLPGQSVELTLVSASHPCVPSQKITCSVSCGTSVVMPIFGSIQTSYCLNDVVVLPTTSTNTTPITGTWSPFPVDTSTVGSTIYTFTPDPILFPCALPKPLSISVEPIEPDFSNFSICSGDTPPILSPVSPNGISGTWNPITVDNMNSAPYVFTPDSGQPCKPTNKTINVTINPSNTILSLKWNVTEAFVKNQIVTITDPLGANYLYQMDSGPFQTSSVFENVTSGMHSVTVKDVNGCSELTNNNVLVIGYPKYFTPNGDTYNDYWNIYNLKNQPDTRIYIFDRYGKLLKDITPLGLGWDGIYIGQPMPADDYWFTVEYIEQGITKKFKSHFSLKR